MNKKTLAITLVTSAIAFTVGDYLAIRRARKSLDIYNNKTSAVLLDLASTLDDPRVIVPPEVSDELAMKLKFHTITAHM